MSKAKAQGTRYETNIVNTTRNHGLQARRLAETGTNDAGDILIETGTYDHFVVEAKHRDRLAIHDALAKAERKAMMSPDLNVIPLGAVVWWKRTARQEGKKRRVPMGEVVVMSPELFLELLTGYGVPH